MPIMPDSEAYGDAGGFSVLMPPPMNSVSYPIFNQSPARAYVGDMYFTGTSYKYYTVGGVWADLGGAIGSLLPYSVASVNLNPTIFSTSANQGVALFGGNAGVSGLISRGDHRHDITNLAQIGNSISPVGNTWYGYQSQQVGGWSFSDFAQVVMSASNVGFSIFQDTTVGTKKDAFQYYDFNSNIAFRIGASGQAVIGSSSAAISNAALTIRPINTGFPGIVIRANSSQTANLQEWQNSSAASVVAITSAGNLALSNVSAHPATPAVGGLLYASAGALVWKGSAGTISQIAPA